MTALDDGVMPDGSTPPGCLHPPEQRRKLGDGSQLCGSCWEVLPAPEVVTGDPSGATVSTGDPDPEAGTGPPIGPRQPREVGAAAPDTGQGWLAHVDPSNYTPAQVELEILNVAARLNSGARFQAAREQELGEARIAFELAWARAIMGSSARAADQRKAEAMGRCEELFVTLTRLETTVRTTREGMHTLRSQLSGLQTVSRSVTASATGR